MRGTCTGCDSVTFIQNKKYGLCGECVYKKNHKGKSKQEVYKERSDKKHFNTMSNAMKVVTSYRSEIKSGEEVVDTFIKVVNKFGLVLDEESLKNIHNQDLAEQKAIEEEGVNRFLSTNGEEGFIIIDDPSPNQSKEKINKYYNATIKKRIGAKRSKPKQISSKQKEINHLYKLTCADMDYTTEPVCTGCLKYQGGDIKLSHSHIISREDCKRIGKPELIWDRNNLTYHCLDFMNNVGCHRKHESPVERHTLADYQKNIEYIKSISEELYLKYTKNS